MVHFFSLLSFHPSFLIHDNISYPPDFFYPEIEAGLHPCGAFLLFRKEISYKAKKCSILPDEAFYIFL